MLADFWREHAGILSAAGLFTAATMGLAASHGWTLAAPLLDWPSLFVLPALLFYLAPLVVVWRRLIRREPWRVAWGTSRRGLLSLPRLASVALVLVAVRFTLLNAVSWKAAIPTLGPFRWDTRLASLDRLIHAGDPWRLVTPHNGPALQLLDLFYAGWFIAFAAVVFWWGWGAWTPERQRRLTALVLVWMVGSMLAPVFASAGPVYYQAVTGHAGPYSDLVTRLAQQPLLATDLQARLWAAYQGDGGGWIKGIAAFPSIHVAMPALYAIATRGRWRWFWWGFTGLTLWGSISLGWHYAVDGEFAVLMAVGCWWMAGAMQRQSSATLHVDGCKRDTCVSPASDPCSLQCTHDHARSG